MSTEAQTWAKEVKVQSPVAKCILMILANYADREGRTFAGQERLAHESECSERTVREWLVKFEQTGLIRREQRRRENGSRTSDFIILQLDAGEKLPKFTKRLPAKSAGRLPAKSAGELPANAAGDQPANAAKSHRQILPPNLTRIESTPLPPSEAVELPSVEAVLSAVLSKPMADAVAADRAAGGVALSIDEATALAEHCARQPDPDQEGERLMATRYRGVRRLRRLASGSAAAARPAGLGTGAAALPDASGITLVRAADVALFSAAVAASGKTWLADARAGTFDPAHVEQAKRALGAEAGAA